ncbi:MAG: hypothetical protein L6Q78_11130 [Bacteroidia bacterium]|nr:hypothetical protein [Bacteroidia bacterium]
MNKKELMEHAQLLINLGNLLANLEESDTEKAFSIGSHAVFFGQKIVNMSGNQIMPLPHLKEVTEEIKKLNS